MEKKKISVIIPVYKVEKFIHACVDSVLQQTYDNLEVILVDDGSPDQCPEICDQYAKQDARVCVIHQENQGVSVARNAGIAAVTGDYVTYLDSDDTLKDNYCEKMLTAAETTGSDIAVGEIYIVDENGAKTKGDDYFIREQEVMDRPEAMKNLIHPSGIRGYVCGKLYKKEIVEGIEFPVGKVFSEDRCTVPKYFDRAEKVCLCPGAVYNYRMISTSVTHRVSMKNYTDLLDTEEWMIHYCEEKYPELVEMMESVYFGRYIYIWMELYDAGDKEDLKQIVSMMKTVYQKYASKSYIRKAHKISYRMIFRMPALYRKLANAVIS